MATFAVSFTLEHDTTWSDRYDSLMKHLRATGKCWVETTSFVLVSSSKSVTDFENDLYYGTLLVSSKDKLLVIEVSYDNAVARGAFSDKETLKALLYGIKIV